MTHIIDKVGLDYNCEDEIYQFTRAALVHIKDKIRPVVKDTLTALLQIPYSDTFDIADYIKATQIVNEKYKNSVERREYIEMYYFFETGQLGNANYNKILEKYKKYFDQCGRFGGMIDMEPFDGKISDKIPFAFSRHVFVARLADVDLLGKHVENAIRLLDRFYQENLENRNFSVQIGSPFYHISIDRNHVTDVINAPSFEELYTIVFAFEKRALEALRAVYAQFEQTREKLSALTADEEFFEYGKIRAIINDFRNTEEYKAYLSQYNTLELALKLLPEKFEFLGEHKLLKAHKELGNAVVSIMNKYGDDGDILEIKKNIGTFAPPKYYNDYIDLLIQAIDNNCSLQSEHRHIMS